MSYDNDDGTIDEVEYLYPLNLMEAHAIHSTLRRLIDLLRVVREIGEMPVPGDRLRKFHQEHKKQIL